MRRGQNISINRTLEEVVSKPHGWLWVEEVAADVVQITWELELEMEPETVTAVSW